MLFIYIDNFTQNVTIIRSLNTSSNKCHISIILFNVMHFLRMVYCNHRYWHQHRFASFVRGTDAVDNSSPNHLSYWSISLLRSGKGIHPWPFSIVINVEIPFQLYKRFLGHSIPQFLPKPTTIPSQVRISSEVDPHFLVQIFRWNVFAKNENKIVRSFL